jgi:predicted metalloenzyme YecM
VSGGRDQSGPSPNLVFGLKSPLRLSDDAIHITETPRPAVDAFPPEGSYFLDLLFPQ